MPQEDYTKELLGLKDVIVTKVTQEEQELKIHLDLVKKPQICPDCGEESQRVHSYRMQSVKDIHSFGKKVTLLLRKRRYQCPYCQRTFNQTLEFVKKYQRTTQRLMAKIICDFKCEQSTTYLAKQNHVSVNVATRMFDQVKYPKPKLPQTLAIDEFKGNAGRKFQCILTDPVKRKVLDILPEKKTESLKEYFMSYEKQERYNVRYVVMDMSAQFAEIATFCFPNAKIIIDKFHVVRHIVWAIESIRKEVQSELIKQKRRLFKRSKWILTTHRAKLKEEDLSKLETMLSYSQQLRNAYMLKERFYDFMNSKDIFEAKKNLEHWKLLVHITDIPIFTKCYEMVWTRKERILRAFETGYTNGYTEGCNNKIKVLKRNCYGVKNFTRFRNRILYMMST